MFWDGNVLVGMLQWLCFQTCVRKLCRISGQHLAVSVVSRGGQRWGGRWPLTETSSGRQPVSPLSSPPVAPSWFTKCEMGRKHRRVEHRRSDDQLHFLLWYCLFCFLLLVNALSIRFIDLLFCIWVYLFISLFHTAEALQQICIYLIYCIYPPSLVKVLNSG